MLSNSESFFAVSVSGAGFDAANNASGAVLANNDADCDPQELGTRTTTVYPSGSRIQPSNGSAGVAHLPLSPARSSGRDCRRRTSKQGSEWPVIALADHP